MTPFRSEKNSNWEGAYRVPAMVRWPGHIKPGLVANDIVSHLDWMPTLLAAAGVPDVKEQLLKGMKVGDTTFKVHLDGYNLLPYLTGQEQHSPRKEFFYFNDDGDLVAYRYQNWKAVFAEQKKPGGFPVWYEPFTQYRIPKLYNLRMDPYERADVVSDQYDQWRVENTYLMGQMIFHAAAFLETFMEYPPSQRPASFSIDQIRRNVDKVIDESFKKRGIEK
jgi:arylsulfatase